jgi:ATP-dependent protease ClpP protease subunit
MPSRGFGIFEESNQGPVLTKAPMISHVIDLGIDVDRRVVHLAGEIEADTGAWFWNVVDHMGKDPIEVHLNTPGGDVDSMYAIHDSIRRHGNITVLGYGQVCSAGVLILACGHKRKVCESTILMSHENTASQGELGYTAAKDRRKVDDWQHVYWSELMARYTPMDAIWWKRKTEKTAEYWLLGGHEIVEKGLADEVV